MFFDLLNRFRQESAFFGGAGLPSGLLDRQIEGRLMELMF